MDPHSLIRDQATIGMVFCDLNWGRLSRIDEANETLGSEEVTRFSLLGKFFNGVMRTLLNNISESIPPEEEEGTGAEEAQGTAEEGEAQGTAEEEEAKGTGEEEAQGTAEEEEAKVTGAEEEEAQGAAEEEAQGTAEAEVPSGTEFLTGMEVPLEEEEAWPIYQMARSVFAKGSRNVSYM